MSKEIKRNCYVLLSISVLCLVGLVVSATYAYFTPRIEGEGKTFDLVAGLLKLQIQEHEITLDGETQPILDTTYKTKAKLNEFTISKAAESTLTSACYNLYLYIDLLGSNFELPANDESGETYKKYLRYSLESNGEVIQSGNFEEIQTDSYGGKYIKIADVQQLDENTSSKTYTLYLWLTYDTEYDQTTMLQGKATQRSLIAHLRAAGKTGVCDETLEIDPGKPIEEKPTLLSKMIENAGGESNIKTRTAFNTILPSNANDEDYSKATDTESGLYKEEDPRFLEEGTENAVYYYAGNVENNWVKFGTGTDKSDLLWRIIRSNEDGSIRLLYAGKSNSSISGCIDTILYCRDDVAKISFNPEVTIDPKYDTLYSGYMYGSTGDIESNRTNEHDSLVKEKIDNWYQNNLLVRADSKGDKWDDYVSKTAIYCNDRSSQTGYGTGGGTYYNGYTKFVTNKQHPSFKCGVDGNGNEVTPPEGKEGLASIADKFTVSEETGNGDLTYPVALMTIDEAVYAGSLYNAKNPHVYYSLSANTTAALDNSNRSATFNTYWWTMTPYYSYNYHYSYSSSSGVEIFATGYDSNGGGTKFFNRRDSLAVRPVLSLKSCVTVSSGDGTYTNPYEVEIDAVCAMSEN